MNQCLNCKKDISEKATFCSDKCRMAYRRRTKKGAEPEQNDPNIQPEQVPEGLTRTDRMFADYAIKRGLGDYYDFAELTKTEKCLMCGKEFKTSLPLLRECSPDCMLKVLKGLTV